MTTDCERALPLLSAYLDRELDVSQSISVEQHVSGCERCRTVLNRHAELHSALASVPLAFATPARLERRIRKAVRRESRAHRRWSLAPWRWMAVPAAAALAAALTWSAAIHRGGTSGQIWMDSTDSMLADLVAGHVRSLMVDHLVDVPSSDQHTVKPWFNGKVDFAPSVADYAAAGFKLVGGRVDYIGGRSVAVAVYARRKHFVNVFMWPAPSDEKEQPRARDFQGYRLLGWKRSGLAYWAVSDASADDLESLERLFAESGSG